MSPGERAAPGRREPARPQYAATAPGYPPPYYPAYGVPHNAWLGAPLISMAGRTPNSRHAPVTKLAVHTQGAPLVIHNNRRRFTTCPEQRNTRPTPHNDHVNRDRCEPSEANRARNQQQQVRSNRGGRNNTDAISVASDESSGSANSETMLPRIIKPRKRRKKDRKPNNIVGHDLTATLELGDVDHSISGVVGSSRNIFDEYNCREVSLPYHLDIKVLEFADPVPETYRVSALGEALEATQFGLVEATSPAESAASTCQCRYCDPIGQIWDTVSIADLLDENSSGDFTPTKLEDSMKVVGPLGRRGTDTTLRRSWSDPSSRAPDRLEPNNGDSVSAPNLYSLFPPSRRASSPEPRSPLALEISSEIVTSINGHRDLEIKLFSTSPPSMALDRRSFFHDKNESALSNCTDTSQVKVNNNVVTSDAVEASVKVHSKSENISGLACLTGLIVGVPSRSNVSDLALVSV